MMHKRQVSNVTPPLPWEIDRLCKRVARELDMLRTVICDDEPYLDGPFKDLVNRPFELVCRTPDSVLLRPVAIRHKLMIAHGWDAINRGWRFLGYQKSAERPAAR